MLLGAEVSLRLLLLVSGTASLLSDSLFGLLPSETREALLVVRNVEATVAGTLHGTEDSVTGGGSDETNIEVSLEGASVVLAISSGDTGELIIERLVLEESTGEKKTGGIGSGVVGETAGNTESLELARVSGSNSNVTLDGGVVDGGDDALVGEADDHSVLLGVVLVLGVDDESLTSVVVGLTLSSPSEFGLVSLGVCFVLKNLYVAHCFYIY